MRNVFLSVRHVCWQKLESLVWVISPQSKFDHDDNDNKNYSKDNPDDV